MPKQKEKSSGRYKKRTETRTRVRAGTSEGRYVCHDPEWGTDFICPVPTHFETLAIEAEAQLHAERTRTSPPSAELERLQAQIQAHVNQRISISDLLARHQKVSEHLGYVKGLKVAAVAHALISRPRKGQKQVSGRASAQPTAENLEFLRKNILRILRKDWDISSLSFATEMDDAGVNVYNEVWQRKAGLFGTKGCTWLAVRNHPKSRGLLESWLRKEKLKVRNKIAAKRLLRDALPQSQSLRKYLGSPESFGIEVL